MVIAVDFDGTCVTHEYPKIGKDIGAIPVLKELVKQGHKLILLTMRSGQTLDEAVAWFKDNDIPLWAVNNNPEQTEWTDSPKVYANMYIDDASLGAPVEYNPSFTRREYIDWKVVKFMLEEQGVLK
jgi:hydroxymethylpyrimidine pyrophosphatase-like HAD family hydrolase